MFCIYVPEVPAREARARKHFITKGVSVRFFQGLHGVTSGLETDHMYARDSAPWNIGSAQAALCVSHYMLWSALNLLPDSHFMVIEDDVFFPEGWRGRLEAALRDVPQDFDMLYAGSCCCAGRESKQVAGEVFDVRYPLCTHAYIVAKKALPVLISTQRRVYAKIDLALYFESLPKLKVYTVLPRIFEQEGTKLPL